MRPGFSMERRERKSKNSKNYEVLDNFVMTGDGFESLHANKLQPIGSQANLHMNKPQPIGSPKTLCINKPYPIGCQTNLGINKVQHPM